MTESEAGAESGRGPRPPADAEGAPPAVLLPAHPRSLSATVHSVAFVRPGGAPRPPDSDQQAAEDARERGSALPWKAVLAAVGVSALAGIAVGLTVGRWGFNPTDEGLILAQARRILAGQVPHAHFITPRPAGSAVLHTVDVLLPGPAFLTSRVIAVSQMLLAAVALATLDRLPARRWWMAAALGLGAGLVNLHTFPLMAWHTVDGIMLVAVGLLVLEWSRLRGPRWGTPAGLALLGLAAVVKQSFFPAPVLGLLLVASSPRWRGDGWARRAGADVASATAPGLLYLALVAGAGGAGNAVAELTGGRSATGQPLWDTLVDDLLATGRSGTPFLVFAAAVLAMALVHLAGGRWPAGLRQGLLAGAAGLAAAAVVLALWRGGLALEPTWGIWQLWGLAWAVAVVSLVARTPDRVGLSLLVLGWMVSLSWGYATPNLVAGSLALATLTRLVRLARPATGEASPWPRWEAGVTTATAATFAGLAVLGPALWLADARGDAVYRDRPPPSLANGMGQASAELRGLRTNPITAQFVDQIGECLAAYPARRFAVVPDAAAAYPAFGRTGALPIDWLWPDELVGQEDRIVAAAERLAAEGDYLVLFQTVPAATLAQQDALPVADAGSPIFGYGSGIEARILDALDGQRVGCGSFVAVWEPRP